MRQVRLGHSDQKLTLGAYTHVASEDDSLIAAQLGDLFGGILDPDQKVKGLPVSGKPL